MGDIKAVLIVAAFATLMTVVCAGSKRRTGGRTVKNAKSQKAFEGKQEDGSRKEADVPDTTYIYRVRRMSECFVRALPFLQYIISCYNIYYCEKGGFENALRSDSALNGAYERLKAIYAETRGVSGTLPLSRKEIAFATVMNKTHGMLERLLVYAENGDVGYYGGNEKELCGEIIGIMKEHGIVPMFFEDFAKGSVNRLEFTVAKDGEIPLPGIYCVFDGKYELIGEHGRSGKSASV